MLDEILIKAKEASSKLAIVSDEKIDKALLSIASGLEENMSLIIEQNKIDLENGKNKGLSNAMLERLELTEKKILGICDDIRAVKGLNSPVGEIIETTTRPNGLKIEKVRVPFGVIGAIYESRPNVSIDIAVLCIKTKNVCVLKGGSEAINSNKTLVSIMRKAIEEYIPIDAVSLIESTDRSVVSELITKKEYIDLIVPRGGKSLIQMVVTNSKVPVIETGAGVCHTYVDELADLNMALNIVYNAKMSRPSVCNSLETVLVNEKVAKEFLPMMKEKLNTVRFKGCKETQKIIDCENIVDEDYFVEYNDYIANVKVVKTIDEAIAHINRYSTKHSETIVTSNLENAEKFLLEVDSACVYHNVSTRFSDGGCFGLGAELGISTQKLHARGPMGLREMTTYKYKIYGNGQVR